MAAGNQAAPRKQLLGVSRTKSHLVTPVSQNTVTVGCKLPHGMHLDIRKAGEPVQRFTLKGTNSLNQGMIIRPSIRGGVAFTDGVPKEFFDTWMHLNKEHPAVKNGLIFHHKQKESVVDMAKDREDLDHGFNPIDPNALPKGVETMQV